MTLWYHSENAASTYAVLLLLPNAGLLLLRSTLFEALNATSLVERTLLTGIKRVRL
jgi:hypothetical protein